MERRILLGERSPSVIHIFSRYVNDAIKVKMPPAFCSYEPWQRQGKRKGRKKK